MNAPDEIAETVPEPVVRAPDQVASARRMADIVVSSVWCRGVGGRIVPQPLPVRPVRSGAVCGSPVGMAIDSGPGTNATGRP